MKKILYCASSAGHLRSFHKPYLAELLRAGCSVTAAAAGTGEGLPEGVTFLSVPFTKSFTSLKNLKAALRLAKLIRRERFDVILTHTSLAAFFTRLAVKLAGKRNTRVINTVHGYLFGENSSPAARAILLAAEKMTASVTDDILVMNQEDERIAKEHRLCRGRLIRIDGMGVDFSRLRPPSAEERAEARRALDIPADAFVLLCAAEFSNRKNQRFLIEGLAGLPEDVFLLLPGQGDLWETCRALAAEKGLSRRVILPGFTENVRQCIWAADACASASRSEGLPFHVMESMACGLPSLLSRAKGHTDLVREGENGFIFPYGDLDAFREKALRLRADSGLRAAMGTAALKDSGRYDIRRVLPQVMEYYR